MGCTYGEQAVGTCRSYVLPAQNTDCSASTCKIVVPRKSRRRHHTALMYNYDMVHLFVEL